MAFQPFNFSWPNRLWRPEMVILGDVLGVLMTLSEIDLYPIKNFNVARRPLRHWRNMPSFRTRTMRQIATG